MKALSVASRLAWSFVGVFVGGLLIIAGFSYFELVMEPGIEPDAHETPLRGVLEIAGEASVVVALLALAGWWFARRALRPAKLLADAAARIHEGNLEEHIDMPGSGLEFERLAHVFNAMTARLNGSFQRIRQFTLHASHELKTPLAILRVEFERLVDDPSRSEKDRLLFGSHLEEIERLAQLVDGLTFLTKADSNQVMLTREPVALNLLVSDAAEDTAVIAEEHQINVTLGHCEVITLQADRHRLRQLLVILCDNAVKYNRPGGNVSLSLGRDSAGHAVICITNTGEEIPPAEHSLVFDRFYRGSSHKADGIDGMGLGLSIASWIVREHGGTLEFASQPDLTVFTVRFCA